MYVYVNRELCLLISCFKLSSYTSLFHFHMSLCTLYLYLSYYSVYKLFLLIFVVSLCSFTVLRNKSLMALVLSIIKNQAPVRNSLSHSWKPKGSYTNNSDFNCTACCIYYYRFNNNFTIYCAALIQPSHHYHSQILFCDFSISQSIVTPLITLES